MPEQGCNGRKWEAWITDAIVAAAADWMRSHTSRVTDAHEPRRTSAFGLAVALNIAQGCQREVRRRRARELVRAMREAGHPICGSGDGIWWGTTAADHAEYQAWRRKHGLAHLAAASADKKSEAGTHASDESTGQGRFF